MHARHRLGSSARPLGALGALGALALVAAALATVVAVTAVGPATPAAAAAGDAPTIAAGASHTCGIAGGAAKCWGLNSSGQLGNNSTTDSSVPVAVQGLTSGVTAIATGTNHSCAVVSGGAWCWGSNTFGQLGNDTTTDSSVPVQVQGLTSGVTAITAGTYHSCAVVSGAAWCWGYNSSGQLGNNTITTSRVPVSVSGLTSGVTAISAGSAHSCAVVSGSAKCWGQNQYGRLGNNSVTTSRVPVQVSGLASGVTAISAGSLHSCAVVSGAAKCWGYNQNGRLGNNSTTQSSVPVQVQGLTSGVTAIAAGSAHSCAVVSGAARCWGLNGNGQLGNNSTTQSLAPVQVSGLTSGVTAIAGGGSSTVGFSCALVSGSAKCWGNNSNGQIGTNTTSTASLKPTQVQGLTTGVTAIATGTAHTCAMASGSASCWGSDSSGQFGNGTTSLSTTPVQTQGLTSGATAVASATNQTCAVVSGAATCWGANASGQLGNGTTDSSWVPVQVSGLTTGVTAIATTNNAASCAVYSGRALCWGSGADGQLGNNSTVSTSLPSQVWGLTSGVTAISAGNSHLCAVVSGAATCWGYNLTGQLGNNSTATSLVPVQVQGLTSGVTAIASGYGHSCALVSGAVWCWGSNAYGQLGNNSTTSSPVPVPVQGLSAGVTDIAVGGYHSCAVASGAVSCWGWNNSGQLGNNSTTDSSLPVAVSGLSSGVTAISGGYQHTCAVVSGTATCWGFGANGQLGNGTTTTSSVPVPVSGLSSGVSSIGASSFHSCAVVSGAVKCWGTGSGGQLGHLNQLIPNTVNGGSTWGLTLAAPTIAGSRSPAANANGWNDEPVTVSFTCVSGALASCTSPQTLSTDGADQSVTGTATDIGGQSATATVSGISIDRVVPTLAGVATTSPNAAGWYRAPVTMSWTCTDALSGVAAGACPAAQTTSGEGTAVSTTGSVVDRAGNVTSGSSEAVQIDLTAPSTNASTPPTWSKDDVTLALTATDNLSGVASTTWSVDGGASHDGTSPVVSGQGVHTVSFASTDEAGNVEPTQTVHVAIDTTAPSIVASKSPAANAAGWNHGDVTVSYTCTDDGGSTVASCQADQLFDGEVDTTAVGSTSDAAGNTASTSISVRIDRSAPTVTANQPTPNASGWFDAPVQVTFSCTDTGGSGIGDGGCPATQMFSGDGAAQPVTATATDVAGNEAIATGTPINLDTTAPTISGAATTAPNGAGGYTGTVTVAWTCDDATSGVAWCPAPQTVTTEGVHVLAASTTDRAGNTSTAEVTVRVDHDTSTDPGTGFGIVRDSTTGNPIAGVTVRLHRADTQAVAYTSVTGTDGRYSFPMVDDGTYLLSATKWGGYLQTWFDSKASSTGAQGLSFAHGDVRNVDVAMLPGYQLTGVLTSSATGAPLSGATVRVGDYQAVSDADGRYTVTGMVANTSTMTVLAAGFSTWSHTVSIPATTTKDVAMAPSSTSTGAKGTVIAASPAGKRLAGAVVKFYVKGAVNPGYTATTGADGRFSLPTLPAGAYEVSVSRAYTRWLGDVLGRSGGQLLAVAAGCASPNDVSWGDACAAIANFTLPTA